MNDFATDDAWQRGVRNRLLVPWYESHFDGHYVLMDKGRFAILTQKQLAADTVAQGRDGVVAIEEKIVRWKGRHYDSICVETDSCTLPGLESPGWAHYSEADFLLYCMEQPGGGLDCHCFGMQELRAWFWPRVDDFPVCEMPSRNRTRMRLVPVAALKGAVPYARFGIPETRAAA